MKEMIKWAVVNAGGHWFDLFDARGDAEEVVMNAPHLHVEKWVYTVQADGEMTGPIKLPCLKPAGGAS